jgi:two-component system sensor histidine kinase HydH
MGLSTMIGAVACAGQLALSLLAFSRAGRNSVVSALARLCAGMFAWTFSALMHDLTRMRVFHVLDVSLAPWVPGLVLDFVTHFVQRTSSLRRWVRAAYVAAAGLSLLSALSPFWSLATKVEGSAWWSVLFVLYGYPALLFSAVLLQRELGLRGSSEERWRTHLLLAALLVSASLGITDLLGKSGFETVRLGTLGTLLSSILMSIGVLRFRLLDRNPSFAIGGYVLGAATLVIALFSAAVGALSTQPGLLAITIACLTAGAALFAARLTRLLDVERAQAEHLVFLGRAADQMAHDLRNPIAALKGAFQVLERERDTQRVIDAQHPMLDLARAQVDRLESLVARYRRLGHVTPELAMVDVAALCDGVVRSQRQACPAGVEITCAVAPQLPRCDLDHDLLAATLDNLIRNSVEAITGSGRVALQVDLREEWLTIAVSDDGPGMAPDVAARAFDDFYTTKADGSGIGLPFVRRVVEAHGGHVSLHSTLGVGTRVELALRRRVEGSS